MEYSYTVYENNRSYGCTSVERAPYLDRNWCENDADECNAVKNIMV